ncbi:MAG: hypothetical protein IJS12_01005 [Lachnospiraceae bacterium]|nr:hypothetical protein [Lachnospiraceae bacterium]
MAGIDRINGTTPYDNNTISRRVQDADASKDDSGFRLLSEEAEGVIYEPGRAPTEETKTIAQIREEIAQEEKEAARANLHSRFDGPGVAVELSTDGVQRQEKPAEQSIADIFRDTWRSIVNFFLSIWNGGNEEAEKGAGTEASGAGTAAPGAEATESTESAQTAGIDASTTESTRTAADTAGSMTAAGATRSSADKMDDVSAFLVDYGGRRLAKNSDLLTQYDRTGHIVDVAPTDRRRILQGEGRVRRY